MTFAEEGGRSAYRHTASHVLAQAVKRLFPEARLAIGPAIADGFYYDFDVPEAFTPEDLERIEAEMRRIIREDLPLRREEVSREKALEIFSERSEPYKLELIRDLPVGVPITIYRQGEFLDLCAGPHVPSTGVLGEVKLLHVAGAYWRGDEHRPMLQRIYGTAFPTREELERYLERLEEARRRDHRKLGAELDLFSLREEGPGFPFFHPKGTILFNLLVEVWRREHRRHGYQEIRTPLILNEGLWHQSGHWEHFRENMYFTTIDGNGYAVKPMNCPGAILVYRRKIHSYRELPLRLGEIGLVHRHELSGALHGLLRVRAFNQDDAHLFLAPGDIETEIGGVLDLIELFYRRIFDFNYRVELSTRPENAMGSEEVWEEATSALEKALRSRGLSYRVNEGDGAFYGPKIDFKLEDSLGRTWQCGTIQLDFQLPERFGLEYVGPDGERHRPVMVHRVIYGAIERFLGILIEHYGGAFPTWLAPVQARILTIAERQGEYARELAGHLSEQGFRVEVDAGAEKIGAKIRSATMEKIPYLLIIGDREVEGRTAAVRHRTEGDLGPHTWEDLSERLAIESTVDGLGRLW